MAAAKELNILILDDDPIYRNMSRSILKERFEVFTADLPSKAFKLLKKEHIDFVISDYRMPEMDGLQVLEKIKAEYPDVEVIMISSAGDMDTVIEALRKGAADFFKKPFTPAELWMAIERTRKHRELSRAIKAEKVKNHVLQQKVKAETGSNIVGSSQIMRTIMQQMQLVAQTPDTSVLVIGESGTGKELVARGIHDMSRRRDEMFGAVNMSAIPGELFESEFFGHKKGSFTGAIGDKAGWFESANKGTLFLDEVGEMSMALQVKLLRVLEDRSYTRVGTQNREAFDVRIVAATNKSVAELSGGTLFRLDLFHRLGTFIIHLPPLRKRKGDVRELTEHFLGQLSQKMGRTISSIHADVHRMLAEYAFPGNVRELRNMIERAVILCAGNQLLPEHFFMAGQAGGMGMGMGMANGLQATEPTDTFDLKELEKRTIIRALEHTGYNKAEASRLLNIEWNALYRRIQKHGINMPN